MPPADPSEVLSAGTRTGRGWADAEDAPVPADRAVLMGADIGGTKTKSVLCDRRGRVLSEVTAPTVQEGLAGLVAQLASQRDELLVRADRSPDALLAAGMGLPAAIHPVSGRLHRVPNIPGLEGSDPREALGAALGVPVVLGNDVDMAALGEHWTGRTTEDGAGEDCLVFIALGTGIGMGVILNGVPLRGRTGAAGEIAWLPVGADPFTPEAVRSGALESVVSAQALQRAYRNAGGSADGTLRDLFARPGDPAFAATLDGLARHLAQAVLSICAVLDPAVVVLGGSVGTRDEVVGRLRAVLATCMADPPEIRASRLGDRAGAIGAVCAASQHVAGRFP